MSEKLNLEELQLKVKEKEALLNAEIDAKIQRNPEKLPQAIYYIVPNEFGERYCFYGLSNTLNGYIKKHLKLGETKGIQYVSMFKSLSYFTPLLGAALSDSFFGKYETIVALSFLYVIGMSLTAIFALPSLSGEATMLVGIIIVAVGTGGIKPCVSAHGGDQFLESQPRQLNAFFNYFYMAINVGAVITGFTTPAIVQQSCFGHEKDCYAYAYGQCAIVMFLAWVIFIIGKKTYRIIPPAGVFLPWIVLKCVFSCIFKYFADGRKKELFEYGIDDYTPQMLAEVREVATMFVVLLPAPIFWMAYDQYGSTFQNQYDQLAYIKFGSVEIDSSTSSNWNTIFIIVLIPIFNIWVYPFIEKRFGNFKLLDRMLVGMFLTSVAFISIGILQKFIDDSGSLVLDPESNALICDQANPGKCLSGWWQVIPYFIIGVAEILFSISGLNFTYSEVGSSMKAVSSSLWLLMVSIGNFLTVLIAVWYKTLGPQNFFYVNAALLFGAMLIYFFIRTQYVYKIDRKSVEQSIAVGEEKLKH